MVISCTTVSVMKTSIPKLSSYTLKHPPIPSSAIKLSKDVMHVKPNALIVIGMSDEGSVSFSSCDCDLFEQLFMLEAVKTLIMEPNDE